MDIEHQRLALLEHYDLSSASDSALDNLVELAASLCEMPIGFLSLLDEQHEWLIAATGLNLQVVPMEFALCKQLALSSARLVIPNLRADSRFYDHPWVIDQPKLCFYAGVPLISPTNGVLGGLCVMDHQPRSLSEQRLNQLERLAQQVLELLTLRAERQRLRVSQRYQTAVELAEIGAWEVSGSESAKIWLSPQVYQQLDLSEQPLEIDDLLARVHPDYLAQCQFLLSTVPPDGATVRLLLRLALKQQDFHWFAVRGRSVWDAQTQQQRLLGVLVDIDDQQRLYQETERFYHHLEQLYQISHQLDWPQPAFLEAGLEVLCAYYGLSSASVTRVQGGVYEILAFKQPPDLSQNPLLEAGQKIALTGSVVLSIFDQDQVVTLGDLKAPDMQERAKHYGINALIGSPYWLHAQAHGVVSCFDQKPRAQDFTALDYEFMRSFCRWLSFMKERKYFVEHLQKVGAGKDRLLAVVAHDLRNSLAAIFTAKKQIDKDLALARPFDLRMMDVIDRAYQRAMALLDELMEAAELEHEQLALPLESLNLVAFVQGIVNQYEPLAQEKNLKLLFRAEPSQILVGLNPRKMLRVFENLLNNALKFTPAGGQIELKLWQKAQAVCVRVEDTGIGIPEHLQKVLFDKYSAARRQGLQGQQSNGLGMYIVREIIELHGGKIQVFSRVDCGTCFQIDLPLVQHLKPPVSESVDT